MIYSEEKYGEGSYGSQSKIKSNLHNIDLMKHLPEYWHDVYTMQNIQSPLSVEVSELLSHRSDVLDQMFIDSATNELDRWEKILGIETDINKTDEFRRERIISKIRGSGTTTKQLIINVASSFSGGEVEVIEYPEQSRFIVKFVGVRGVPANMIDLTNNLNEIKPAHLAFEFEYTYKYWNTLTDKTWGSLNTLTWEQVRTV